jgi:hypothetical protein
MQITNKIVSVKLKEAPSPQQMHEGISRPENLAGHTYKLKLPSEDSAIYVTINNIVLNDGTPSRETRPFEIFINCKNTAHRQWIDSLTRVTSAVFRKGGDINFLVEELKSITDPNGGGFYKGRYIKSLVSEIGYILENHISNYCHKSDLPPAGPSNTIINETDIPKGAKKCSSCGAKAVIMKDGCPTCLACGDSKCG